MKAATMLFKVPGPHKSDFGNYEYTIVDEDEVPKSLEDGWFLTVQDAVKDLEARSAKAKEEAAAAEAAAKKAGGKKG